MTEIIIIINNNNNDNNKDTKIENTMEIIHIIFFFCFFVFPNFAFLYLFSFAWNC